MKRRTTMRLMTGIGVAVVAAVVFAGGARVALAQAPAPMTAQEKANVKVIEDFIAAWEAKDGTKVMSFFAEDARFAVGEIGKTPNFNKPNFAGLLAGAKSVSMIITPGTTWARGPVVTHERVDKIVATMGGQERTISGKYIAVFTLRDGKIVDFIDFDFCPGLRPECM